MYQYFLRNLIMYKAIYVLPLTFIFIFASPSARLFAVMCMQGLKVKDKYLNSVNIYADSMKYSDKEEIHLYISSFSINLSRPVKIRRRRFP